MALETLRINSPWISLGVHTLPFARKEKKSHEKISCGYVRIELWLHQCFYKYKKVKEAINLNLMF